MMTTPVNPLLRTHMVRQETHIKAMMLALTTVLLSSCAPSKSDNIAAKPVGTASRAWIEEQRANVSRSAPEPSPASRAAAAVQRYEASSGAPATSGSRSGSAGSSVTGGTTGGTSAASR